MKPALLVSLALFAGASLGCSDPVDGTTTDGGSVGPDGGSAGADAGATPDCESIVGVDCETFAEAYVKAEFPSPDENFGAVVDLTSDTLVVAARDSVYVFALEAEGWRQQARLRGVGFGSDVAIQGDTLVVGGSRASDGGAAYVYERNGGEWSLAAELRASNADPMDSFGWSVALDGDILAVGAPEESAGTGGPMDNTEPGAGAVYVFARRDGAWAETDYVKASDAEYGDEFGYSLALQGSQLFVGAPGRDGARQLAGSLYVFELREGSWLEATRVDAPSDDAPSDEFGYRFGAAIAVDGDWLAAGGTDGGVIILRRRDGDWAQEARLEPDLSRDFLYFGWALALDGDLLVVGAPLDARSGTGLRSTDSFEALDSGASYLYRRTGNSWNRIARVKASSPDPYDSFGTAVAIHAGRLAIAAPFEDGRAGGINGDETSNETTDSGAVYLRRVAP